MELNYTDSIFYETVRRVLKAKSNHGKKGQVIPLSQNSDLVAGMEKMLDAYKFPYDPDYPVGCMDESLKRLMKETRMALPATQVDRNYATSSTKDAVCITFSWPVSLW